MGNRQADGVLHSLSRLVEAQAGQQADGQLLRRFAAHRDEGAFAVLVHRHGPLVYGVCRNILRSDHDAEDAFQATFLVLARRAGLIREGQALGSWLYRVAYRVSMKARTAAERRRQREDRAARGPEDRPAGELAWRELQAMLDEELNRLPLKYRAPFVLCCLTGKSKAEAAVDLGWREGTVSSRLARARQLLQGRLARRGVTLSAVLSGLAISQNGPATAVPAALVAAVLEGVPRFLTGEGVATAPAGLARAVLRGMTMNRLATAGIVLVALGLAGTTAVAMLHGPQSPETPPVPPTAPEVALAPPAKPGDEPAEPAPNPVMTMSGSVIGPFGAQFPGADIAVFVSGRPRPNEILGPARHATQLLGRGRANGQGQYELSVPQTSHGYRWLTVWASSPGHAPAARVVEPQAITNPKHEFRGDRAHQLIPGVTVRGRLLDSDGRPAKKVTVLVLGMINQKGPIVINVVHYEPPVQLPGWPKDVVTDDEGIFTLRDIGPNTKILLQVRDERYATSWLSVTAGNKDRTQPVDLALPPPRTLVGRLTAQDTGKPLANAAVVVQTMTPYPTPSYGSFPGYVTTTTDDKGEFRVRPFPGERLEAFVYPAQGEPYLVTRHYLKWPAGATEHRYDLAIPRGIPVRGTVKEAGTDRAVAGAAVIFQRGYENNPYRVPAPGRTDVEWRHRDTVTDADGEFTMTVPPGPGLLLVQADEPDFIRVETGSQAAEGGKGGKPYFPNAFVPLRLRPNEVPADLSIRLRRGVVFRGRVVASDGSPAKSALLFSRSFIPDGIEFKGRPLVVRAGRFELPGCEPDGKVAVWVYDPQKKEAGFAEFPAGVAGDPVVRLAPCVAGHLRVVDPAGKPARGAYLNLELVIRPGDDENDSADTGTPARIGVSDASIYSFDLQPTPKGDGTYPLPDLIPGATYAVKAMSSSGSTERVTFVAPKTGVHDAGNLVVRPYSARRKPVAPPTAGRPYVYEPKVVDPDGDPVTFDLVQGPAGMISDPETGVLFWVPAPEQVGVHTIVLRVSDPLGAATTQKWQINIRAPQPDPNDR